MNEECPFKIGDTVVYKPSARGRAACTHTDLGALEPGKRYRIAKIEEDKYLILEGFEDSPGGGLFWTEFSRE